MTKRKWKLIREGDVDEWGEQPLRLDRREASPRRLPAAKSLNGLVELRPVVYLEPEDTIVIDHAPARPSWVCHACGEIWPCVAARGHLKEALSPVRLAMYMWMKLEEAVVEEHFSSTDCAALFDRFIHWTRDPSAHE